jgi:hypothetical protein
MTHIKGLLPFWWSKDKATNVWRWDWVRGPSGSTGF